MTRKLSVGVLAAALLMSGALVGVSFGGGGSDIAQPTVLEFKWNTKAEGSWVEHFFIEPCDASVPVCGQVTLKDMPLFDLDGNRVGRQHISCTVSDTTEFFCEFVTRIKDGPNTDKGRVVAIGVKGPRGIHNLAIVGGTGAYENAGGQAIEVEDGSRATFTLFLVP